jgi:hypothetical protein
VPEKRRHEENKSTKREPRRRSIVPRQRVQSCKREFMGTWSLQMQQNSNMNMQLNLTFYTTPYYNDLNGSQFSDLLPDYPFDDTIEGAVADNFSDAYCPSYNYQNLTYLNVSCDAALNFSLPLYGTCCLLHLLHPFLSPSPNTVEHQ